MSTPHRLRIPPGSTPLVEVGHRVEPAEVLATRRPVGEGTVVEIASRLRRSPADAADLLRVAVGGRLDAGQPIAADGRGREVVAADACLFLGYDRDNGKALVAPLGPGLPVIGHVRGDVSAVSDGVIEIDVAGELVTGIGGVGRAVHGEIAMAVSDPTEELRATAIDVGSAGRILVGGSRASAETLTRARAMGAAGIVLGGVLDKELRDFTASSARRRGLGGEDGGLAIMVVSGYGKVAMDGDLFSWLGRHDGHLASLFGADARLFVYDAEPAPVHRSLPRAGDRVVLRRKPRAGMSGTLVRVLPAPHASVSGLVTRSGIVRLDDGRSIIAPVANLVAMDALEAPNGGG